MYMLSLLLENSSLHGIMDKLQIIKYQHELFLYKAIQVELQPNNLIHS